MLELSRLSLTLGCQFEDKVDMTSTVWAVENGAALWRVHHDTTQSKYRLDVSGDPPAALEGIKAKWFAEQDQDGGEKSSVDISTRSCWSWPSRYAALCVKLATIRTRTWTSSS